VGKFLSNRLTAPALLDPERPDSTISQRCFYRANSPRAVLRDCADLPGDEFVLSVTMLLAS
jgi:hypothetical protein